MLILHLLVLDGHLRLECCMETLGLERAGVDKPLVDIALLMAFGHRYLYLVACL
jgi:hypothetical protein